jgi:hypothetical protein
MRVDELKFLITLTGRRLPHLEEEIFSNEELMLFYLRIICTEVDASPDYIVCYYARYVIKGRWLVAEPIILRNVPRSYEYAREVIKDRWPEAEFGITKESYVAFWYAHDVIKGRWPEGEYSILRDSYYANKYAEFILGLYT